MKRSIPKAAALAILFFVSAQIGHAKEPPRKLNVLLISIDTLRADHLGCYGSAQKTPAIDAFAAGAVLFENVISQVPLTLPSHCTILTGLYPDEHGVLNNEAFVLPAKVTTLAEIFRKNGYATGAVVGSFSLDSTFGIDQGFDFYDDKIASGHDPNANRYVERRAETVWALGKQWLMRQKGPWFCFLHFFDPHTGYNPPGPYPQTYDGEIAYVDHVMSEVLAYPDAANTIIVLLSDHGEGLGEHGESSHGVFLYDSTLRVPLIARIPGVPARKIPGQVRLVDVAPTIAELASLQDSPAFSGQSLAQYMKAGSPELPAFSETYYTNLLMGWAPLRSMRWNRQKWIDAPKSEFYDLASDPKELHNLYVATKISAQFRTEMGKHKSTETAARPAEPIDPETKEKLASLGYVTGSSNTPIASNFDPKDGIDVWNQIEKAVALAQTGNLDQSQAEFEQVLKKQPNNVIAQKFLANVLRKKGENRQAIVYLKAALSSPLHQDETRIDLAETYFVMQDYPHALDEATTLLKTEPRNARALKIAALASDHQQQDAQATAYFDRLAAIRPLTEEEAIDAAAIRLTANDPAKAEQLFRAALKANPQSAKAWKGLGLIFASHQQWNEALDAFLKSGDCGMANSLASKPLSANSLNALHNQCGS